MIVEDYISNFCLRILIQKEQMTTNPTTAFWTHSYSKNLANKAFLSQTQKFSVYKNWNGRVMSKKRTDFKRKFLKSAPKTLSFGLMDNIFFPTSSQWKDSQKEREKT